MSLLNDEQKLQDDLDNEIVNKIGSKIYNELVFPRLVESNEKHAHDTKRILDGVMRHIVEENDFLRHQISRNENLLSILNGLYYSF